MVLNMALNPGLRVVQISSIGVLPTMITVGFPHTHYLLQIFLIQYKHSIEGYLISDAVQTVQPVHITHGQQRLP